MGRHEKERPRYKLREEEKEIIEQELYEQRGGHCEHPGGCNVTDLRKLTLDHFTPQCVARIWEWTPEEVNDPNNLLLLCRTHHNEKDALTPVIKIISQHDWSKNKTVAREQRRKFNEIEEQRRIALLDLQPVV